MKTCNKCNQIKDLEQFYKDAKSSDGLRSSCKQCHLYVMKEFYTQNKDIRRLYKKRYNLKNKEAKALYNKDYYELHKDVLRPQYQKNSIKYRQNNKANVNALAAKYRATRLNATPKWLTKSHKMQINEFYSTAEKMTLATKIIHVVDHIIPLQGKTVCGLHVPWNLQILTLSENAKKSNKLL